MPAVWFENPLANALFVVVAALVILGVARRLIIHAAGPVEKGRPPRRPGAGALPPSRMCPNGDCAAPNRADALYCRRCGTRIDGGKP